VLGSAERLRNKGCGGELGMVPLTVIHGQAVACVTFTARDCEGRSGIESLAFSAASLLG
jgi:hypothetical protein